MPVEENRWRYKVTAESMSLDSVEPRRVPKHSCNGGPMKRANAESEGQLRPRPSSAYFRHATIPSRGSVNVPSRSKRTFTIGCCHKINSSVYHNTNSNGASLHAIKAASRLLGNFSCLWDFSSPEFL